MSFLYSMYKNHKTDRLTDFLLIQTKHQTPNTKPPNPQTPNADTAAHQTKGLRLMAQGEQVQRLENRPAFSLSLSFLQSHKVVFKVFGGFRRGATTYLRIA